MAKRGQDSVSENMQARYDEIVTLTDPFCGAHLTAEYAQLCRKLPTGL